MKKALLKEPLQLATRMKVHRCLFCILGAATEDSGNLAFGQVLSSTSLLLFIVHNGGLLFDLL